MRPRDQYNSTIRRQTLALAIAFSVAFGFGCGIFVADSFSEEPIVSSPPVSTNYEISVLDQSLRSSGATDIGIESNPTSLGRESTPNQPCVAETSRSVKHREPSEINLHASDANETTDAVNPNQLANLSGDDEQAARSYYLRSTVADQEPDGIWSDEAENQLREAATASQIAGLQVQRIHCAATVCELEVYGETKSEIETLLSMLPESLGWQTTAAELHSVTDLGAGFSGSIFIARSGMNLSAPELTP